MCSNVSLTLLERLFIPTRGQQCSKANVLQNFSGWPYPNCDSAQTRVKGPADATKLSSTNLYGFRPVAATTGTTVWMVRRLLSMLQVSLQCGIYSSDKRNDTYRRTNGTYVDKHAVYFTGSETAVTLSMRR